MRLLTSFLLALTVQAIPQALDTTSTGYSSLGSTTGTYGSASSTGYSASPTASGASGNPVTTTESPAVSATGTPGHILVGNLPPINNTYPETGNLTSPLAAPYFPEGGNNTNATSIPVYEAFSDFDWFSLSLVLYQEWIELDLFEFGLSNFSTSDFDNANLTADDRYLIQYMADQEKGHAQLVSDMLGPNHPPRCNYSYPTFTTVYEFIDFCQKLTRWGEAGVYGFLPHLDSRAAAQMLLQSITVEARQQLIFRQFSGLFPMPEWFEVGIPQSFAWTLLAPHITSCPADTPRLPWQNFPALHILNNPNATNATTTDYGPAITHNRTALSHPGQVVNFLFESPGQPVGPNCSYTTSTSAGPPVFAAWISQLNVTYTPLYNISYNVSSGAMGGYMGNYPNVPPPSSSHPPFGTYDNRDLDDMELYEDDYDDDDKYEGMKGSWEVGGAAGLNGTACAVQPNATLYYDENQIVNGTVFVVLTDTDLYVTPHNISAILPHVRAGPAIYQAG